MKSGAWSVCRFKIKLGKKKGGGVFEGVDTHCTLWFYVEVQSWSEAICDNWNTFKNNEKYFLFHVKDSFWS